MQVQYVLVISKRVWQNLPRIILKPNQLVGTVVRDIVISVGRGGSKEGMWEMYPPTAIIKHVFEECNFSIMSNLFNNNKFFP